jgi:hypothetical protein
MRHPNSGLPEFGIIIVQVGYSRLGCAGPESILTMVVMDSGLALRAPRNDGGACGPGFSPNSCELTAHALFILQCSN